MNEWWDDRYGNTFFGVRTHKQLAQIRRYITPYKKIEYTLTVPPSAFDSGVRYKTLEAAKLAAELII